MHILLAHEDPDQHYSFQQAIEECPSTIRIASVYTGIQLLDYLLSESLEGRKTPDLIITDMNIAFIDGIEVIRRVKGTKTFGHIPVYLFSKKNSEGIKSMA